MRDIVLSHPSVLPPAVEAGRARARPQPRDPGVLSHAWLLPVLADPPAAPIAAAPFVDATFARAA